MEQIHEIAQWVINNRYPKSEYDKVSDAEMYSTLVDRMSNLDTMLPVARLIDFLSQMNETDLDEIRLRNYEWVVNRYLE